MNSAKKLFYITVRILRDNIEIYINSVLKFWSNSILKVYSDRKETLHCHGACALKGEQFAFYLQSGHSSSALHLGPSLFCRTRLRLSCMQKFCIYNKPQVSRLIIWKVLVELFEFIKYEPFFRSHGNFIVISHKHYSFAYQQSYVLFGFKTVRNRGVGSSMTKCPNHEMTIEQ